MADLKNICFDDTCLNIPEGGSVTKQAILSALGYEEITLTIKNTDGTQKTYEIIGKETIPVTYKTTLFTDGAFIINEPSTSREANIQTHGAVVAEYAPLDANNPYVFAAQTDQPWDNEKSQIRQVSFGSPVSPTSMAYWFHSTNAESIDFTNCDTSQTTSIRSMFYSASRLQSINFDGFDFSALTTMEQAFRAATALRTVSMKNMTISTGVVMTGMLQGCTSLTSVNFTGTKISAVSAPERLFADDAALTTITVSNNLGTDYSQFSTSSGSSGNMFRGCTSLVGGAGTVFDANYITSARAKLDGGISDPGYFTGAAS